MLLKKKVMISIELKREEIHKHAAEKKKKEPWQNLIFVK